MSTGKKFDSGKPMLSLIPSGPWLEVGKALTYGAQKYDPYNWTKGIKWSRLIDAKLRHTLAFNAGDDLDDESGLPHLAHSICSDLFLLEFMRTHRELDDRHKNELARAFDIASKIG
jgi:hypothetical protein